MEFTVEQLLNVIERTQKDLFDAVQILKDPTSKPSEADRAVETLDELCSRLLEYR